MCNPSTEFWLLVENIFLPACLVDGFNGPNNLVGNRDYFKIENLRVGTVTHKTYECV